MEQDPQYMMNKAKRDVVLNTLKTNNGSCTFIELFRVAEEFHCDVLAAVLMSLKRAKVIDYKGMLLLSPVNNDEVVTLLNPEFDPFQ